GALDLLKSLTSYTMTIQLLQTTRIGVAVNSVRKHCSDEEVVASAKILIKNWKRLLEGVKHPKSPAEKQKEKHKERDGRSPTVSSKKSSSDGKKERWVPGLGGEGTGWTPPSCRGRGLDPLLGPCCHPLELVLFQVLQHLCHLLLCLPTEETIRGETPHIFQELKSTDMKYRNRVRSRISNLKDPKNPNLRRNVLCGAIPPSLIARMTAEEMASDELKELRNAMTQEAIREHQMAKTGGTVTDLFQCGKCKKKNCTYNQVQTRSADEPMTTFVLCNECGNRWKVC
ncbi:Transcription elongation factor A protein 3, partial [Calypte anna]